MQLSKHYPTRCSAYLKATPGSAIKVVTRNHHHHRFSRHHSEWTGLGHSFRSITLTSLRLLDTLALLVSDLEGSSLRSRKTHPASLHRSVQMQRPPSPCSGPGLGVFFSQGRDRARKALICWRALAGSLQPAWKLLEAGGSRVSPPPHVQSL